jgi:hypothetical protein
MAFNDDVNQAQIGDFVYTVKKPEDYEVKCETGYTTLYKGKVFLNELEHDKFGTFNTETSMFHFNVPAYLAFGQH